MNIKAHTRNTLAEKDTTLLLQVELAGNNAASQDMGPPSSKDPKGRKAIMVKKVW